LTRVARIASRKGVDVIAPIFESEPEQILESAKEWVRKGCRIVVALSDRSCLAAYYAKVVFRLKELEREIGKFSTSKRS
jgi:diphthamide synthase (EF-2-diphthine--ammonia ligase)